MSGPAAAATLTCAISARSSKEGFIASMAFSNVDAPSGCGMDFIGDIEGSSIARCCHASIRNEKSSGRRGRSTEFQISRAKELSLVWVVRLSETGGNFLSDREARIRERAYAIWQAQGGIDGHHEDHWLQAEQELGDNEPLITSDEMAAETSGLESE